MAMAAESGLRIATLASMRLRVVNTASIASGIPCPLIFGVPYCAMNPTISPPMTGIRMTQGPRWCVRGCGNATKRCGKTKDW